MMFNEMFNTFGTEEHREYPELSSVDRQQLIATINAAERIPRVSLLLEGTIEGISGRDIIDAMDDDTFNICMDHEEYAYDADDMLETLTDLRAAVNWGT